MEDQLIDQSPVKNFSEPGVNFLKSVLAPALIVVALILGGGVTGFFLSGQDQLTGSMTGTKADGQQARGGVPKEAGIDNPDVYKDRTQGRLEENNNKDIPEGSHRLIRPGGEDQIAYLTSSILDLNLFLGECIEIWGETHAAQKAGWLMDVGRVELLDSCPEGL